MFIESGHDGTWEKDSIKTYPEEQPLQCLAPLELIFEAEGVVLVREFEEI